MTKKDYRKIAWALWDAGEDRDTLLSNLVSVLKRDNPLFDEERFRLACETGEGAAKTSDI